MADVISHLGSGAVIFQRRLEDALAGKETPDEFSRTVWDEWDAKSPDQHVHDGLAADEALTARLEAVSPEERERFGTSFGPLELDWTSFVRLRLAEHLLHEWDVTVALDPATTLAADGTGVVVDNLDLIVRFTTRPPAEARTIAVATREPERSFILQLTTDGVTLQDASATTEPDLVMPAESFVRLVYGRLDAAHTPATLTGDDTLLEVLRHVFPGP